MSDKALNPVVQQLRNDGFPEGVSVDDYMPALNERDSRIILAAFDAVEDYGRYVENHGHEEPVAEQLFLKIRQAAETAILAGHLKMKLIQEYAVTSGALPDPRDDFLYYRDHLSTFHCWECDAEVQCKTRHLSVHDSPIPLAGSGRVERVQAPWCPNCEREPSDTGIIRKSQYI